MKYGLRYHHVVVLMASSADYPKRWVTLNSSYQNYIKKEYPPLSPLYCIYFCSGMVIERNTLSPPIYSYILTILTYSLFQDYHIVYVTVNHISDHIKSVWYLKWLILTIFWLQELKDPSWWGLRSWRKSRGSAIERWTGSGWSLLGLSRRYAWRVCRGQDKTNKHYHQSDIEKGVEDLP